MYISSSDMDSLTAASVVYQLLDGNYFEEILTEVFCKLCICRRVLIFWMVLTFQMKVWIIVCYIHDKTKHCNLYKFVNRVLSL